MKYKNRSNFSKFRVKTAALSEIVFFISRRPIADEGSQVLDEVVRGREAQDAEAQQDPSAGMARLGRVVHQLLANLTINRRQKEHILRVKQILKSRQL